jgi:hypothetical protein
MVPKAAKSSRQDDGVHVKKTWCIASKNKCCVHPVVEFHDGSVEIPPRMLIGIDNKLTVIHKQSGKLENKTK